MYYYVQKGAGDAVARKQNRPKQDYMDVGKDDMHEIGAREHEFPVEKGQ